MISSCSCILPIVHEQLSLQYKPKTVVQIVGHPPDLPSREACSAAKRGTLFYKYGKLHLLNQYRPFTEFGIKIIIGKEASLEGGLVGD